ncbi:putative ubiquitin-conjugating enzyme E2 38 [Bienertia sinuspersici]
MKIVGNEIAAVDEDNHDDAVIIAEKDASNGNGKKLMLNNLAGHEVNTIDGVIPSPKTNEIVEDKHVFHKFTLTHTTPALKGDKFDLKTHFCLNISSQTEATVPSLSASTNEKHAVPASSSLLSGTQTNSKVNGSKENNPKPTKSLFKSLFSKSFFSKSASCFGSKLPSFRHRATSIKMHESSSASATEQPSSSAGNLGDTASATEQPSSNAGNLGDTVSATQQPSLSAGSGYFDDDEELKLDDLLSTSAESSSSSSKDSILNKLKLFKKFDILDDHLDHFYESSDDCSNPPNNWVKSVADEWKMLEKDLPDTIYVRVYEGRMDLLRAVMVGADGTPYHDGLFFFDVHFPAFYPKCPPAVKYHSHGLRINPNLYGCGRVCLSLLGTWAGTENENWRPFKSNMLQVLVSIQGLILTAEPYVNEPFITLRNIDYFVAYREHVYIKSLKTMLYTLKNPPKCSIL